LSATPQTIQRLLQDPLWNKDIGTFDRLQDIYRMPQLDKMKETFVRFKLWGVGSINQIGVNITPGTQFTNDFICPPEVGSTQHSNVLSCLTSLNTRDFHLT
jgi:hypothetical protein